MREILFRGKTKKGRWASGAYYHQTEFYGEKCDCHYIVESCDELEDNMIVTSRVLPETVGQFTGLFDKNCGAIFEQDIVIAPICYDSGCYPHTEKRVVEVEIPEIYKMNIDGCFEIIGNVHDNPELLGDK